MRFPTKPTFLALLFIVAALGATPALSLGSASLASASTPAWKCGGRTMPGYVGEPVAILDGVVLEKGAMIEMDPSIIDRLEITCWDPESGEFSDLPGVSVVLMWTKALMQTSALRLEDVLVHSDGGIPSGRQSITSVVGVVTLSGSILGHDGRRKSGIEVRVRDSGGGTLTDEQGHFVVELTGLRWPIELQVVGVEFMWWVGGAYGGTSFIVSHGPKEAQARKALRRLYDAGGA